MQNFVYITAVKQQNIADMRNIDVINYSAVSKLLTGNSTAIRKNHHAKKYDKAMQELDDLIDYWKKRNDVGKM